MSHRADVLHALREAAGAGVSGEVLARKLGISRAAVAKHVAVYREIGYGIEAHAGSGYRLVSDPDLPLPEEVGPLVTDPFWVEMHGGLQTVSTNDDAKGLARSGAPEGTVVVAARQTGGRGRLGRAWESPTGGVYLSAVLRPDRAPSALGPLPLVVGVGVARGLNSLGCRALLKWPNDVWSGVPGEPLAGKLAGILLEMQAESDTTEWVVAGIGINVRPGAERFASAGYVGDLAHGVRCARVAAAVLEGIAGAYREFTAEGFAPLLAEYEGSSALSGRLVTVADREGIVRVTGRVAGVDEEGRLVLDSDSGRAAVTAGDVTLSVPR
ncbi:MAG: biotin--[acetyl-CoA-carboxylase] ligase [Actinobacteria bacterium HGW-Actinobacteria-10]|jgi:BirA family biotin operon repressor/biotin-[acetyl-CoA-carboxylase] ligase|nr:MAG: biotin--[acetyl-CoA-carboxylase] ligase [Actinobacteria bacterium HGW-Actinobacteria-10]